MRDFVEESIETSITVARVGRTEFESTNEANVENITVLDVMNATSSDAVAKLVKIWENKNAQRALRGAGLSTMALSLAACGSDSADEVVDEPVVEEPVVTPVALELTTAQNIFTDLTTANDTITGTQATMTAADVIVDDNADDSDTLTITSNGAAMTFGTVAGIENIVVNVAAFGAANGIDVDGIAAGTLTVNNTQLGGSTGANIDNAGDITVVAGTGVTGTLDVAMVADAATIVNAGSATQASITAAAAGIDQAASVIANGDVAVVLANDFDSLTISSTAASVVTVTDGGAGLATIAADANTTVDFADIADAIGIDITGAAAVSGVADTAGDLSSFANIILSNDDAADVRTYIVADGATVTIEDDQDVISFEAVDADADAPAAPGTQSLNVILAEDVAQFGVIDDGADGDDNINVVNVTASVALTGLTITSDASVTINLAGAEDVTLTAVTLGAGSATLDATGYTGVLTASAQSDLNIIGGSGDDDLTAAAGGDVDGGLGDDTLTLGGANVSGDTIANIEIFVGSGTFAASQLNGLSVVVSDSAASTLSIGALDVDTNTLDMSGVLFGDATNDGVDMTAATQAAALVAGSAMTITGTNGADTLLGFAGADTINGGAGADIILSSGGADIFTGGAGSDAFTFASGDSTEASMATITDYALSAAAAFTDTLVLDNSVGAGAMTVGANIAAGGVNVGTADADGILAAADITAVVADGILTIDGAAADVAVIDTLAEWIDVAELALASYDNGAGGAGGADDVYVIAFEFGGDTYVISATDDNNAAVVTDNILVLEGVTGVDSVDTAAALNAIIIA